MHQTNMAAALTATAKTNAYKTQLSVVTDAADVAVQAQAEHEAKLKSAKDRVDRNYKELQQEREGMKDYTVTDNVHHNGESAEEAAQDAEDDLELGESQDGDTLASMKKALAATKKQASEEVAQAQQNAALAISKVKAQVEALKTQQKASMEMSQKKEAAAVRHVAAKAMMAVNAAKLAGALNSGQAAAAHAGINDVSAAAKAALIAKMHKDRRAAETAAHVWKADAHKLAKLEKDKIAESKMILKRAQEGTKYATEHVKLSNEITQSFKKIPSGSNN